jgi:transposase
MPSHRPQYSSDLTDAEWRLLEPLLPPERPGGRHRAYPMREVINAIQYVMRGGCAWRLVPHDLPHWRTAYEYFRVWQKDGTWVRIHDHLHERLRQEMGREAQPSAAVIDSQSVKTTEKGGPTATTGGRRSAGVSATSSLIRRVSCCAPSPTPPTSRTKSGRSSSSPRPTPSARGCS